MPAAKVSVARSEAGQAATRAICLCAEKAAADKDQRKPDSKNQVFAHFYPLKILIVVNAEPKITFSYPLSFLSASSCLMPYASRILPDKYSYTPINPAFNY